MTPVIKANRQNKKEGEDVERQGQKTERKVGLDKRGSAEAERVSGRSGRQAKGRRRALPQGQRDRSRNGKSRRNWDCCRQGSKASMQGSSGFREANRRNSREACHGGMTRRTGDLLHARSTPGCWLLGATAGHSCRYTAGKTRHGFRRGDKCGRNNAGKVSALPQGRRRQGSSADQKDSEYARNGKFKPPHEFHISAILYPKMD